MTAATHSAPGRIQTLTSRAEEFPAPAEPARMRCPNEPGQIELHSQARSGRHRSSAPDAAVSAMIRSSRPAGRSQKSRLRETSCIAPVPSKRGRVRRAALQTSRHAAASARCNRIVEDHPSRKICSRRLAERRSPRSNGSQTAFHEYVQRWLSPQLHADHLRSEYKESNSHSFEIQLGPGAPRLAWHREHGRASLSSIPRPIAHRGAMRQCSRAHSGCALATQCLERSGSRSPR